MGGRGGGGGGGGCGGGNALRTLNSDLSPGLCGTSVR